MTAIGANKQHTEAADDTDTRSAKVIRPPLEEFEQVLESACRMIADMPLSKQATFKGKFRAQ